MWRVNWAREAVFEVLIDLRIAEDRFVSSAEQAEKDEPAGQCPERNEGFCVQRTMS